jgi:hypothetical protein
MEYAAYDTLGGRPNVVVDGYGTGGTILTLSHWPGSATPPELRADLSTQIAFRALDAAAIPAEAEAVSNNHFDEDGLCGIFAVLHPAEALARRALIEDVASAGDFGVFRAREAVRIAFALTAYADDERSPLPIAGLPYPRQTEVLYTELLGILPSLLDDPGSARALWEAEDARLARDEDRVARGEITIEELPEADLAVVRAPGSVHEYAINNATARKRVLLLDPPNYSLRYRYESWVVYVSEPVMPRVDLGPLAARRGERDSVKWKAGSNDDITPSMRPRGESSLAPDDVRALAVEYLTG